MKLHQLIRRPTNQEELIAQVSFYRFIAFGVAIHIIGFAAGWLAMELANGR